MVKVSPKYADPLGRCGDIHSTFHRSVPGYLEVFLRQGAFLMKDLGALELLPRQYFSALELVIVGKSLQDIRTVDNQQQVAFLYVISNPRTYLDGAAAGHGDHRHVPAHIRRDRRPDLQFVQRAPLLDTGQLELFRFVYSQDIDIRNILHFERWQLGPGVHMSLVATARKDDAQTKTQRCFHKQYSIH